MMDLKKIIEKTKEYIGPYEAIVILLLIAGIMYLYRPAGDGQALVTGQDENITSRPVIDNPGTVGEGQLFKVMDSRFQPYLVDSLCLYTDPELTEGFITLTKNFDGWQMLCSTQSPYYMWVQLEGFFPTGQLMLIHGVAHNEQLVQFHFRLSDSTESLLFMTGQIDSLIQGMQQQITPDNKLK